MTLTQLNAFVLVARLGSVRAAAAALGVSESAVSQAITALRQDLGDQLITRKQAGMTLTPGGTRLLGTASQIVVLGAEAHAAVRAAQGAPEQLRVIATSTFAEFVAGPLLEAFRRRFAGAVEITTGVAAAGELGVLIANRLADVAIGPEVSGEHELPVVSEPVFKYRLAVVGPGRTAAQARPPGPARQWRWLVDPSGTDPDSETAALLRRLAVADSQHPGLPEPDRRPGRRRRRRGGRPGHRAPGSPTSCAAAGCPSSTFPDSRPRSAGTPPCSSGSAAAPPRARCAGSSAPPRQCS